MRPLLAAILLAAAALPAQASGSEFRTPSSNIACYYEAGPKTLVCIRYKPSVLSVFLFADEEPNVGPPETDSTSADPKLPVLEYGRTWTRGPVSCISERSGLTCRSGMHGFGMSRAAVKAY